MARNWLKIPVICLLSGSVAVVGAHAQRGGGGGRAAAERRSNAISGPSAPSGAQSQAVSPGTVNPSPRNTMPGSPVQPGAIFLPRPNPGAASRPAVAPRVTAPLKPQPVPVNQAPPVATANNHPAAQQGGFIGPVLPPPVTETPERRPPAPPRISFEDGLLTLECTNSRLGDVLNGIKAKAGIQFDGMDSAPELVAAKLGPAPADEVLSSLLQGSRFDYVVIGKPDDPHTVERVMLSAKTAAPAAPIQPIAKPPQPAEEEEEPAEEPPHDQPSAFREVQPEQQEQPQAEQQPFPAVQTPEQLLERLNQLKAEQQKNQGAGAAPPNTAPLKRPIQQLPH